MKTLNIKSLKELLSSSLVTSVSTHELTGRFSYALAEMQMTEGSSVPCHVIQGTCAEVAQLWQLNMATNMENWSGLEV